MNKKDFIKLYRKKLNNLTIAEAKEDVEAILEIIEAGLKKMVKYNSSTKEYLLLEI